HGGGVQDAVDAAGLDDPADRVGVLDVGADQFDRPFAEHLADGRFVRGDVEQDHAFAAVGEQAGGVAAAQSGAGNEDGTHAPPAAPEAASLVRWNGRPESARPVGSASDALLELLLAEHVGPPFGRQAASFADRRVVDVLVDDLLAGLHRGARLDAV